MVRIEMGPQDIERDVERVARLTRKQWEVQSYITNDVKTKGLRIPVEHDAFQSVEFPITPEVGFGVFLALKGVKKELDQVSEQHVVFDKNLVNHISEHGDY